MKRLRTSIVNQSFDFELSKKKVAEILQEVENNQLANYENLLVKVSQPDIKVNQEIQLKFYVIIQLIFVAGRRAA